MKTTLGLDNNKDLVSYISYHDCLGIMQVPGALKVLQNSLSFSSACAFI